MVSAVGNEASDRDLEAAPLLGEGGGCDHCICRVAEGCFERLTCTSVIAGSCAMAPFTFTGVVLFVYQDPPLYGCATILAGIAVCALIAFRGNKQA